MPLSAGIIAGSGNMPAPISEFFKHIDKAIADLAGARHLSPSQVRLLQPCNLLVLTNKQSVFVVLTNHDVGTFPKHFFRDLDNQPMNLQTAFLIAETQGMFKEPFGFSFSRIVLNHKDDYESHAKQISERYMQEEVERLEKLDRMVRLKPIFQGRDFLIDEESVFVLSPFKEPFDTIYIDHIKPTVERIRNMQCSRADDIYDNKAVIEDIWRSINEARIIIAELTAKNPNVFYEVGIAHTVGKEVILITQTMDDVPFDLRHLRCIVYEYTPRGIKLLEDNLTNTIETILRR